MRSSTKVFFFLKTWREGDIPTAEPAYQRYWRVVANLTEQ
jgi:hypothetical protein